MRSGVLRKVVPVLVCIILLFTATYETAYPWGFYAHKKINRMAIFTLPSGMIGFYKKHIDYITEHAVDADKRRYIDTNEAARHYIDIDHYGPDPFHSVPVRWDKAVEKYSYDTLIAYGIVPWHINHIVLQLSKAFQEENTAKILSLSADLGHYVGDAFVPLHATVNYNGQLTGQNGIHAFWESRIPELKGEIYNYFTGKAGYIEYPLKAAWQAIETSFLAKDSVLLFEAELNRTFPPDRKYAFENRGSGQVKVYSEAYSNSYERMLDGMIERRMRGAILTTGSLWYTAWVNAGQPDLHRLTDKEPADTLHNHQFPSKPGEKKGHDD